MPRGDAVKRPVNGWQEVAAGAQLHCRRLVQSQLPSVNDRLIASHFDSRPTTASSPRGSDLLYKSVVPLATNNLQIIRRNSTLYFIEYISETDTVASRSVSLQTIYACSERELVCTGCEPVMDKSAVYSSVYLLNLYRKFLPKIAVDFKTPNGFSWKKLNLTPKTIWHRQFMFLYCVLCVHFCNK